MADELFQVKIITREAIKPSSPTPQRLKDVKLSVLDQSAPDMYVPKILFYPFTTPETENSSPKKNPIEIASERSRNLKQTLSKTLAHYYPLAGRLRENFSIECNDEGAEFIEARAEGPISEILREPDLDLLKKLLPVPPESKKDDLGGCLLLLQATIFGCGSIALGLSISHKISDACTLAEFLKTWSKTALGEPITKLPDFALTSQLFPPIPGSSAAALSALELFQDKTLTKRYVIGDESLAALKIEASSEDHVANPSRIEAVSALIWKCAIEASSCLRPSSNYPKTSVWAQALNLRKRLNPPLGDNVVGNLFGGSSGTVILGHEDVSLKGLAGKIRKGLREAEKSYAENSIGENQMSPEEYTNMMRSDMVDFYNCSSWCRYGFYRTDLGFGEPVWVSTVSLNYKNIVVLMDVRHGEGIEVWLCLKEEDMAVFESNQEWLAFASSNPSVI